MRGIGATGAVIAAAAAMAVFAGGTPAWAQRSVDEAIKARIQLASA